MTINLVNINLAEFVKFIFEHPVANLDQEEEPWHWDDDLYVDFDPAEILRLYVELFSSPAFLLDQYNKEVLDQGFWALQSNTLSCSVVELIWDVDVDRNLRKQVIFSMFTLYKELFAINSLDTSANMWWDSIAYDYCCGNKFRDRSEEEREMQDAIFKMLGDVLYLNSLDCQIAALHGLGHLRHPETETLILQYLESHPELDSEVKKYAMACITGEIM